MINFRGEKEKEERLSEGSSLLNDGMCAHTCLCACAYGMHLCIHVHVICMCVDTQMCLWCVHDFIPYMHMYTCLWCMCMTYVHGMCACVCGMCVCAQISCSKVGVGGRWKLNQAAKWLKCIMYANM